MQKNNPSSFILHPSSFRLDSHGEFDELTRFSFAGDRPFAVLKAWENRIEWITANGVEQWIGDPFEALRDILNRYTVTDMASAPPLRHGGMIGYLGYELKSWIEQVSSRAVKDLNIPDLWFGCYQDILTRPHSVVSSGLQPSALRDMNPVKPLCCPHSNYTRQNYLDAVQKIKAYILSGDVYQVNLAQRLSMPWPGSPEALYAQLCRINPAPFSAYLNAGNFQVLSISPERYLQYVPDTRRVETRPIKGTRPRGRTETEDANQAEALRQSAKDQAEHLMIVDLERNDLGRVCETGSVQVTRLNHLNAHPTVWHLVSTVEGHLREDCDRIDLLRATFPGGSITGAPKIRAMDIIDELEPTTRGVYTGAIGYLGFDGSMDLNIAIRTLILKDRTAYFHVGGGIVADSDPEAEYEETMDKARAIIWALSNK
jgi:para-aminobenzoate synthetase component I